MSIKLGGWLGLGAGLALLGGVSAGAQENFDFTFLGNDGLNAFGVLTAVQLSPGTYLAQSGFLEISTPQYQGTYSLVPNPNPDGSVTSVGHLYGGTDFIYDDLLFPTQTPTLDVDGLVFFGNGIALDLNLSSYGAGNPTINLFELGPGNSPYGGPDGVFTLTDDGLAPIGGIQTNTPDAGGSLALLGLGVAGLGILRRKLA